MPIYAKLREIDPRLMSPQHMIDANRVTSMRGMNGLPPPVVADFGEFFIPIDGHHRISASSGRMIAWVFDGEMVEDIEWDESQMICGDTHAMDIAGNNV